MSGKPNPDGVNNLRNACRTYSETRKRITELQMQIDDRQREIEKFRILLRELAASILASLEAMDVSSQHNAGWEGRRFEFLLLMSEI